MSDLKTGGPSARLMLTLASTIIVIAGMRQASQIIVPFLLALFLAQAPRTAAGGGGWRCHTGHTGW